MMEIVSIPRSTAENGASMSDRPRDLVLSELIRLCPNGFRLDRLPRRLRSLRDADIEEAASELEAEGLATIKHHQNAFVSGRQFRTIGLSDNSHSISEVVQFGDHEYPRMIAGDMVGGEDLNGVLEVMGEIAQDGRDRIERVSSQLTRRYWVNTA